MKKSLILLIALAAIFSCCKRENFAPIIQSMYANPDSVFPGETVEVGGSATDYNADELSLQLFYKGEILEDPTWIAPKILGDHYIVFYADDGINTVEDSIRIYVKDTTGVFVDPRDNHEYKWVKIGQQVWMAENLAYLPEVEEIPAFSGVDPFYMVYDFTGSDFAVAKNSWCYKHYGVLYNLAATNDSLCPDGWILPDANKWDKLFEYLGENIGAKMRSEGYWGSANESLQIDRSGFEAVPAGTWCYNRSPGGAEWVTPCSSGHETYLWYDQTNYLVIHKYTSELSIKKSYSYTGHSVRCVKDE